MATLPSRNRAFSGQELSHDGDLSPISSSALDRIRVLLALLTTDLTGVDVTALITHTENRCDYLRELLVLLIDSSHRLGRIKDDFRRLGGFDVLLRITGILVDLTSKLGPHQNIFELLKLALHILAESLSNNDHNRSFFIRYGGKQRWRILEHHMLALQRSLRTLPEDGSRAEYRLFDLLFTFAIREEGENSVMRRFLVPDQSSVASSSKTVDTRVTSNDSAEQAFPIVAVILWNPEIIPIITKLWTILVSDATEKFVEQKHPETSVSVLSALQAIFSSSHYNAVALNESSVAQQFLELLQSNSLPTEQHRSLMTLTRECLSLGLNSSVTARELFRLSLRSSQDTQLFAEVISSHTEPPHFVFDLSLYGHASLELPAIRGKFPPNERIGGFTIMVWARIDGYDKGCHTTIFGAFDQTQTCFVLLYLERESRQLVLQTSINAERPSVRFKSTEFITGRWYHIGITQETPRSDTFSRATLFVDGEYRERVKCRYPQSPPPHAKGIPGIGSQLYPPANTPVQAFVGTPKGLAPKIGTGVLHSRWSLASCQLVLIPVPEELLFVYKNLGPSYVGNFQDSLGSFQTYSTSTALNLRNEHMHSGNTEQSIIAKAIKTSAKKVNAEQNFALNVIAASGSSNDFLQLISKSKTYREDLHNHSTQLSTEREKTGSSNLFNLAVTRISDPTSKLASAAVPLGGVYFSSSQRLDQSAWQVCGCVGLAMKILEDASNEHEIMRAVHLVFGLVRDNWRISEAFERENAFSTMAWLLRSKAVFRKRVIPEHLTGSGESEPFSLRVLRTVLDYTGYQESNPESSVIANALAYRALIVDSDIWRSLEGSTQQLYYKQFVDVIAVSRFAQFNIKRLTRMRILKRLINALKSEIVDKQGLPAMLEALKHFIIHMPSSETYRSIALYITYAVSQGNEVSSTGHEMPIPRRSSTSATSQALRKTKSTKNFSDSSKMPKPNKRLSNFELGVSILQVFVDLICEDPSGSQIRRFARTVTNKWLLYLLAVENPEIVRPCMQLLCQLLVLHGPPYMSKFDETTKGFLLLRKRLKKWWHLDVVWNCGFSIMFGFDLRELEPIDYLDATKISSTLFGKSASVYCPAMFPVLASMLEAAAHSGTSDPAQSSGLQELGEFDSRLNTITDLRNGSGQEPSSIVCKVCTLLRDVHSAVPGFRDFAVTSNFTRDIIRALFTRYSGAENIFSPVEGRPVPDLLSIDETRGVGASSVVNKKPSSSTITSQGTISQTVGARRRNSSFVLVERSESLQNLSESQGYSYTSITTDLGPTETLIRDQVFGSIATLLVDIFTSQILDRKDFTGLGLFFKAPPCAYNQRSAINSHLMVLTMRRLQIELKYHSYRFNETKILMNLARFCQQTFEAYMEGWFVHGAIPIVEFTCAFVEYTQQPKVQRLKEVQLCSPSIASIQLTLGRASLFHMTSSSDTSEAISRLKDLLDIPRWRDIFPLNMGDETSYLAPFCCAIMRLLTESEREDPRQAETLLREFLDQRPDEVIGSFIVESEDGFSDTLNNFLLAIRDNEQSLSSWISENSEQFQKMMCEVRDGVLVPYITTEERIAMKSAETRSTRRKERLEQWHLEDLAVSHSWTEHRISAKTWTENIINAELHKYHRSLQDQQASFDYLKFHLEKVVESLRILQLTPTEHPPIRWQLDDCEGRDRMRLRLSPLLDVEEVGYEPKTTKSMRRATQTQSRSSFNSSTTRNGSLSDKANNHAMTRVPQSSSPQAMASSRSSLEPGADGFEMITEPGLDEEEEDKNRKVMRSLQRGEQVLNVFNVSRIVGLEAREGLLIIGKTSLYLVDGLFQRADGEVVNVAQAPANERDQYTQILSGHEVDLQNLSRRKHEPTRHWQWSDILSFSKRNFLTRSVAVEIFFTDGRSYLLTTTQEEQRNVLYSDLMKHTNQAHSNAQSEHEETWRAELLKNPAENSSRLSSFLSPLVSSPITKKWMKGETSNFHYLMWINSQAGRTFNDLTQYPIFPWVLADYTSDELDLSNPRSFRDLTKPMGCQTIERSEAFRERYTSLAEMDEQTPPFHYGTHYSSAMIVTSFLIRLQPFVQSHVLLQGGSFDHATRLFHSVEQAWRFASQEGFSDVRELIPEFYYLPDFLTNVNKYNFGFREGDNETVDDVRLPPWAKGDPAIFISKHREALESPYVSQNLHAWIDLIFGFKQRGEAAIEATNVFHYLSYPGAKDLDKIHDKHERAATIGIIHNFGQTPRQIFMRPHDRRDHTADMGQEILERIGTLARLRAPIQELHGAVSLLQYSRQLTATVYGTCHVPTGSNIIVDWAYPDHSVRFWTSDRRRLLSVYEQLHDKAILTAMFVNGNTFLTAAEDGTVSTWKAKISNDSIELHPKTTLFGHRSNVHIVTFSRAYSVLITGSTDGTMILWDLNRMEHIRQIECGRVIQNARVSDHSGHIIVCGEGNVQLFTLNGRRLLDQNVSDKDEGRVISCTFYRHASNAWFPTEIVLTGHERGIVKIWTVSTTRDGQWSLVIVNRLTTVSSAGDPDLPNITALLALDQKVWAGDESGRVFEWNAIR